MALVMYPIDNKPIVADTDEQSKETALAKLLLKSEQDISNNRVRPVREFFKELRREKTV